MVLGKRMVAVRFETGDYQGPWGLKTADGGCLV